MENNMFRFFANIDTNDYGDRFLAELTDQKEDIRQEDLYPFVDQYAGKAVTDLLICISCQYSIPESKVLNDSVYKYEQKMENGIAVDYTKHFRGIYKMYKRYGIDPIRVWTDRCRDVGLTPWLTLRMNDCHAPGENEPDAYFLRPDFYYEARKNGWLIGQQYGYYSNCWNYAVPEVRNLWLAFLDEQLEKYDVDGVELDFQREIHCFDYLANPDCYQIMNDFMREVKKIVTKHARIKGHPIQIGARLVRDLEQSKVFGFDAVTWNREGLVDMIVVTARWATCDSDMPIREWKEKLTGTEIYAGLETLCVISNGKAHTTPAVARGYANKYLSEGADGMYLFNYYPLPDSKNAREIIRYNRSMEMFGDLGSLEQVRSKKMRYLVAWQDMAPQGCNRYLPLPVELDGTEKTVSLQLGEIPKSKKVKLILGLDGIAPEQVVCRVNGEPVGAFQRENPEPADMQEVKETDVFFCECGYVAEGTLTYSAPVSTEETGSYTVTLQGACGKVTYLEFVIE